MLVCFEIPFYTVSPEYDVSSRVNMFNVQSVQLINSYQCEESLTHVEVVHVILVRQVRHVDSSSVLQAVAGRPCRVQKVCIIEKVYFNIN